MKYAFFIIGIALVGMSFISLQPCKGLVKSNVSKLAPYTHNGQVNTAYLSSGESIEFQSSYNRGINYRICTVGENITGIYFKVFDADHKEIYNSKEAKSPTLWEFNIEETQDLTVEVFAPKATDAKESRKNSCVALLIGFRVSQAPSSRGLR